jgi:hypothetical protein
MSMKSYNWDSLNEEGRYTVWSEHIEAGGLPMTFFKFCDVMDEITSGYRNG